MQHPVLVASPLDRSHDAVPFFGEAGWPSRAALVGGTLASSVAVLFLLFDATLKVVGVPEAMEGTMRLGYPIGAVRPLGVLQYILLLLYAWPRSRVLAVMLWTGYLGGAVATHLRVGSPLVTSTLFPVYVGCLLWGGLWLRDSRVRVLLQRP